MEAIESARAIDPSGGINKSENAGEAQSQKVISQEQPITVAATSNLPIENDEMDEAGSLSVTHALEALLGGLEPVEEVLTTTDITSHELDTTLLPTAQKKDAMEISPKNDVSQEDVQITDIIEADKEALAPPVEEKVSSKDISQMGDAAAPQPPSNAPTEDIKGSKPIIPGLGLWNNGSKSNTEALQESTTQHIIVTSEGNVEIAETKDLRTETASKNIPKAQVDATVPADAKEHSMKRVPKNIFEAQVAVTSECDVEMADAKEPPMKIVSENIPELQGSAGVPADGEEPPTGTASEITPEVQQDTVAPPDEENGDGEHPEWEIDSSPIESSSDDSSSDDSSSDESEEGENAYKLLSPEEQARILMKGDGDSDDEGAGKANGSGAQLRTKNEVPEVVIPKPDVVITENMPITELGVVDQIVDNILLIKAKTSGEYKVLESGSVLCLADRSVIGVVAETIGRVQQPFYSVLFTNPGEVKAAGLSNSVQIYYSEQHSTFIFTQALKAFKGSDASNLHDEEVGDEEMEFSDDEAEAEHKRRVKQKKMERRGGKTQQNGSSNRGGHPLQQQHTPYDASKGLSYDDNDDGLYTPLARPASYASIVGRSEPPQEGSYSGNQNNNNRGQSRDNFRGRGRGDRGRGDRGRGRGDRGRGRGAYQDRRSSSGFSLPPQSQPSPSFQPSPSPVAFSQSTFQPQNFSQPSPNPTAGAPTPGFYNTPQTQQYSPNQPQISAWPQFQQPNHQPNPYQPQPNAQNNWPGIPLPGLPGGAFINPAFFNQNNQPSNASLWSQDNERGGRNNRGT